MDHNQQIEALRLNAPERVGVERMRRVDFAADTAVIALDMVIADIERAMHQETRRAQLEQSVRLAEHNGAAAAVIAEAERVVSEAEPIVTPQETANDPTNPDVLTAKAIEQATSAASNPLFRGLN